MIVIMDLEFLILLEMEILLMMMIAKVGKEDPGGELESVMSNHGIEMFESLPLMGRLGLKYLNLFSMFLLAFLRALE